MHTHNIVSIIGSESIVGLSNILLAGAGRACEEGRWIGDRIQSDGADRDASGSGILSERRHLADGVEEAGAWFVVRLRKAHSVRAYFDRVIGVSPHLTFDRP